MAASAMPALDQAGMAEALMPCWMTQNRRAASDVEHDFFMRCVGRNIDASTDEHKGAEHARDRSGGARCRQQPYP